MGSLKRKRQCSLVDMDDKKSRILELHSTLFSGYNPWRDAPRNVALPTYIHVIRRSAIGPTRSLTQPQQRDVLRESAA
jgi:hypothetical protein